MSSNPQPNPGAVTSQSLLESLRKREESAWEQFVPLYGPLLYSWCRRSGIPQVDAGDLLQQILAKVWGGISEFKKTKPTDSFRGWLVIITRNAVLDYYRVHQGKPIAVGGTEALQRMNHVPAEIERSTEFLNSDLRALANRALEMVRTTLPPESQRLFELTVLQEKTATEAAAMLNSTPAAVRKAKSRILRRLREILGELP